MEPQPFTGYEPVAEFGQTLNGQPRLEFLWLEITRTCNLECLHCYADSGPDVRTDTIMTLSDWKRVLDQAYACGCRKCQFIGGEPTTSSYLPTLIVAARERGFSLVEVYTNGLRFSDSLRKTFVQHKVSLAFSVYSSQATVHDAVTGRAGSMAATLKSIRWALDAGLQVRVGIVDLGSNSHTLHDTREHLRRLGVKSIRTDRQRAVGRGASGRSSFNSLDELCGQCARGRLCVTASGDVLPCVFSRFWPVGKSEEGLSKVLTGQRLGAFREAVRHQEILGKQDDPPNCMPDVCIPDKPACDPDEDPQ